MPENPMRKEVPSELGADLMVSDKDQVTILLIGTVDTKPTELQFLKEEIQSYGHRCLLMDVGILGPRESDVDISREEVWGKADSSLEEIKAHQSENEGMKIMAAGASLIASELAAAGQIQGVLVIGGTMGTDLGLEVAQSLPFGLAKVILTTVAFSPVIPPERVASDLTMMLWTGGLWGMNAVSTSILQKAAGSVVGAAIGYTRSGRLSRPAVGISSLGTSGLKYVPRLWDELDKRGYDSVLFHSVGPGGRSLENMVAQGELVAVLDLCLLEFSNYHLGSVVHSGPTRLEAAGRYGIPQIVAPGALDAIDFCTWAPIPADRAMTFHTHNRLVGSAATTANDKSKVAKILAEKLNAAEAPTSLIVPTLGLSEWSKPEMPLYDPEGMVVFVDEVRKHLQSQVSHIEIEANINDEIFVDTVLEKFDAWVREGVIPSALNLISERS